MLLYKNLGRVAKTYYGIQWRPNDTHAAPGYINDTAFLCLGEVKTVAQHVVKFKNYDGKLISSDSYLTGEFPKVPEDPSRKSSNSYSYVFSGWKPAVTAVTTNIEYVAQYSKIDLRTK